MGDLWGEERPRGAVGDRFSSLRSRERFEHLHRAVDRYFAARAETSPF